MKGNRYSRNHPLWLVYKLQYEIIKKGGKIDRTTDLLAYLEGRSLIPETNPIDFLFLLSLKSYKNKEVENLIHLELIVYKKTKDTNLVGPLSKKKTINSPMPYGYDYQIPEFLENEREKSLKGYLLSDNELVYRRNISDTRTYVIVLNPQYADILRLIFNRYQFKSDDLKMNNNLLSAIIISLGLILSSIVYAYANRYEIDFPLRIDKWTGTMQRIELKK